MRTGRMTSRMHIRDLMYTRMASKKPVEQSEQKLSKEAVAIKSDVLTLPKQASSMMQVRGMASMCHSPCSSFDPNRSRKKSWYRKTKRRIAQSAMRRANSEYPPYMRSSLKLYGSIEKVKHMTQAKPIMKRKVRRGMVKMCLMNDVVRKAITE